MFLLAFLMISIEYCSSLQFINVTSPIKLTQIFVSNSEIEDVHDIAPDCMTYYVDPNDVSNTKYLWYGMESATNEFLISFAKSDIFDTEFMQYNITNSLPFIIADINTSEAYTYSISKNTMCTSPITNDILTCWFNQNIDIRTTSIYCKLYFVKTNIFSDIISIVNASNQGIDGGFFQNTLCFHDSYFIPWYTVNYTNITNPTYTSFATLLDLNGNIIYKEIRLGPSNFAIPQLVTKGGNLFKLKGENDTITDLFTFVYSITNFSVSNTTNFGTYGYYTNINDTEYPIHIYYESAIIRNIHNTFYLHLSSNIALNWNHHCCYISNYYLAKSDGQRYFDIYATITDIYGNNIFPQDVLLESLVTSVQLELNANTAPIIDLPIISDKTRHYFMMTLVNIYLNASICSVYYLQYDTRNNLYNFEKVGHFHTIKAVHNGSTMFYPTIYIMPNTNNAYFSWQEGANDITPDLYGQTWQIL